MVVCGNCGRELGEASSLPEPRQPCPTCGSVARRHELELAATVRASGAITTVFATPATARASAPAPTVRLEKSATSIEEAVAKGTFTRTVVWSKTPEAWFAEVRDAGGNLVAVEVAFDAVDTLVVLADHLLPPGQ